MVDLEKIKRLLQMMADYDLVEISLKDGEEEVNLKRPNQQPAATIQAVPQQVVAQPAPLAVPAALPAATQEEAENAKPEASPDDGLLTIKSPMVGTFYRSPDPESAPYIEIGTRVTGETVVCIVEAMKVFNEIKSEISGTIERILAQDQDPIEYGQDLFMVRPA